MPTENRSSNTELSKIVTEALVGMVSGVTGMKPPADEPLPGFIQAPIDRAVTRISGLLAQPAQGEPVALAIPQECPHLIVFDDTEVASLMFSGAGARAAALKKWESISTSWNAHLFVRVSRNSRDDGHPCATVADPCEVERLRTEVKRLDLMVAQADHTYDMDRAAFRRELVERDALLDRVVDHAKFWHDHPYAEVVEGIARDYKALSASAEPEVKS